jgi:hypothetical protein
VRTHGAGLLLGEALLSVNHTLHSKAPHLLQLLLSEDLLAPEDFAKKQQQQQEKEEEAAGGSKQVAGEVQTHAQVQCLLCV